MKHGGILKFLKFKIVFGILTIVWITSAMSFGTEEFLRYLIELVIHIICEDMNILLGG